jgi:hypothetical protein
MPGMSPCCVGFVVLLAAVVVASLVFDWHIRHR